MTNIGDVEEMRSQVRQLREDHDRLKANIERAGRDIGRHIIEMRRAEMVEALHKVGEPKPKVKK